MEKQSLNKAGILTVSIIVLFIIGLIVGISWETDETIGLVIEVTEPIVVISPVLTNNAYKAGGFYAYFKGECDESCLTLDIVTGAKFSYISSNNALFLFNRVGTPIITDYEVSLNPEIISKYDKVILLHNEYVTRGFYEAILAHPNVYYMYPNALYAEIEINEIFVLFEEPIHTMTLVRGHGYPDKDIKNGFDWEFENTHPDEFDTECMDYEWKKVTNGYQLNCYPENIMLDNPEIFDFVIEN